MSDNQEKKIAEEGKKEMDRGYARDPQTGKKFKIEAEKPLDTTVAIASMAYLFAMMLFFLWLLADTWLEKYTLFNYVYDLTLPTSKTFKLFTYAGIGGGLGGIVNGARSIINWHCTLKAFGWRFISKDIMLPWLGMTIGLIIYALISAGLVFVGGGSLKSLEANISQSVSALAAGFLAGYSSHAFFVWFDAIANKVFKVRKEDTLTTVPQEEEEPVET